jgi:hypothetical protein
MGVVRRNTDGFRSGTSVSNISCPCAIAPALLVVAIFSTFGSSAQAVGPTVHIVIAAEADPLEKFAADEMAEQLKKLFDAKTQIVAESPTDAVNVILLGNPATHREIKALDPPVAGLQGDAHLVRSRKRGERVILVVAGGSPRSVLWGAYELGWRFGIRYFAFGDLLPTAPPSFTLEGFDWRTTENPGNLSVILDTVSPVGLPGWGIDEQRRYALQLVKLKVPAVMFVAAPDQTVTAAATLRLPVDGDTAGRSAFARKKFFENPDVAASTEPGDRQAAAQSVFDGFRKVLARFQIEIITSPTKPAVFVLPVAAEMSLPVGVHRIDDARPTPEQFAEMLTSVCGDEVSDRVFKAYTELSAAETKILSSEGGFQVLDAQQLAKHFDSDEPPPAWWAEVRTHYLNAMNEMYRANTRAREGGRQFTLWYARRFEFAMEYMNVVEALRKAGIAKRKGNKDEQIAELEKALDSLTGACNAIAATARSQSDRGIIAVMNEYGYRPVTKLLEEADAEN